MAGPAKAFFISLGIVVTFFAVAEGMSGPPERSQEEIQNGVHCLGTFGGYRPLQEAIVARLRNPDSFELVDTTITPLHDGVHTVTMTYRAQNGFGGMNVETARARVGSDCEMSAVLDQQSL